MSTCGSICLASCGASRGRRAMDLAGSIGLYGRYEYPMAIHSFVIGVFTTINIIVFVDTRHKTGGELWNVRREGERHTE